mmetsp:Transcript_127989/g.410079  ORF Transcript_127989/g.410079 Transcript_127989/m.410079 type:complete len:232 (-) Transcript_127989:291-986(-)
MPIRGPKKRDTKSTPRRALPRRPSKAPKALLLAQKGTMPRASVSARMPKSGGFNCPKSSAEISTKMSPVSFLPLHITSSSKIPKPRTTVVPTRDWLPADPTGASAGKFISIMPDSSLLIVRMPLWRVVKLMASVFGQNPASHKACAAANVPCPHKATSTVGVNHRNPQELAEPSKSRQTNAVSDKFISRAIRRMLSSSKPSAMQTAAGLPPKAASANESTVQICVCVGRVT